MSRGHIEERETKTRGTVYDVMVSYTDLKTGRRANISRTVYSKREAQNTCAKWLRN